MFYLGIDVSKAKLDCLLLDMASNKRRSKSVPNAPDDYAACWPGSASSKRERPMSSWSRLVFIMNRWRWP